MCEIFDAEWVRSKQWWLFFWTFLGNEPFAGEKGTKICGAASVKCYQNAKLKLFGEDVIDGLRNTEAREFRTHCNCLASCTSIKYEAEINRVKLDFLETLKAYYGPYKGFYDLENPPGFDHIHLLY